VYGQPALASSRLACQTIAIPCLISLMALPFPRLATILLVVFSNYIDTARHTMIRPQLGFFFMPLTKTER